MRIWVTLCIAAMSTLVAQHAVGADDTVGVRQISAPSRERGVDLNVTVWYPAQAGGTTALLGDSAFFVGTAAMRDAPIVEGKFPLILLSHGAGLAGNPEALSWIATPLARRGFVVAAPTHPGNSGASRSAAETMKIWLRPGDLSETLNAVQGNPFLREHVDQGRTGALGLSMGGSTVLALAGARMDPRRLADYCDTDALNPSLCGWVRQSGVDLHAMNMQAAGRDNRDTRIRFVMAIDPAPADIFEAKSFGGVDIPVDLVNLGQPGKIPVTAQAAGIARSIPNAHYATIEDASHYSMFGDCKPGAPAIILAEKIDDPLCADGGGRSRRAIHQQLIEMATRAFRAALKTDR